MISVVECKGRERNKYGEVYHTVRKEKYTRNTRKLTVRKGLLDTRTPGGF